MEKQTATIFPLPTVSESVPATGVARQGSVFLRKQKVLSKFGDGWDFTILQQQLKPKGVSFYFILLYKHFANYKPHFILLLWLPLLLMLHPFFWLFMSTTDLTVSKEIRRSHEEVEYDSIPVLDPAQIPSTRLMDMAFPEYRLIS